jgi:uncharacterized protein (DUF2147 family)
MQKKLSSGVLILFLSFVSVGLSGQSVTGKWKTIDDETGEERSIVELYEKGGAIFGKVMRVFPRKGGDPDPSCDECPPEDPRHKKKVIGMDIIRNMKDEGDYFGGGDILDPKVGKVYKCRLWLEGKDLKVRGYWGLFYRTQTWKRVN